MNIGHKIKEFRTKTGMTQKDLADQLHVTYQAVSRWENNEAEPSFDTLKEMCRIFNCTANDLFEIENPVVEEVEVVEEPVVEEKPQIIEKVIIQETKPVLSVCEDCNTPIFDSNDIHRININKIGTKKVICSKCYNKFLEQNKKKEIEQKELNRACFRKRRIHSIIWPALLSLIFIIVAISSFIDGDTTAGISSLITGVAIYTFVATMILKNTFIPDMWLEITSWGFVRMPGVIFQLSFDGVIFLIVVKILFFILGVILALLAASFATVLALFLSIFVYPFALVKNLKGIE